MSSSLCGWRFKKLILWSRKSRRQTAAIVCIMRVIVGVGGLSGLSGLGAVGGVGGTRVPFGWQHCCLGKQFINQITGSHVIWLIHAKNPYSNTLATTCHDCGCLMPHAACRTLHPSVISVRQFILVAAIFRPHLASLPLHCLCPDSDRDGEREVNGVGDRERDRNSTGKQCFNRSCHLPLALISCHCYCNYIESINLPQSQHLLHLCQRQAAT